MFNVGDIVKIKENANTIFVKGLTFNTWMLSYLGQEHVIHSGNDNRWKLENVGNWDKMVNNDGYWLWANDWLEPVYKTEIAETTEEELISLFE